MPAANVGPTCSPSCNVSDAGLADVTRAAYEGTVLGKTSGKTWCGKLLRKCCISFVNLRGNSIQIQWDGSRGPKPKFVVFLENSFFQKIHVLKTCVSCIP